MQMKVTSSESQTLFKSFVQSCTSDMQSEHQTRDVMDDVLAIDVSLYSFMINLCSYLQLATDCTIYTDNGHRC